MPRGKLLLALLALSCLRAGGEGGRPQRALQFEYTPVHADLWKDVNKALAANEVERIYHLPPPSKTRIAEWDEYRLLIAKALMQDKAPLLAQYLLTSIATKSIGTNQGNEALRLIYELGRESALDESVMEDLAFDLDAKIDDPETQAMLAYYRGRMLLRKGYLKWANQALTEIGAQTTWKFEVDYDQAMQTLAKGDSTGAYEKFTAIAKSAQTRRPTAIMAQLAIARLFFERKDYASAIGIYHKLDLPVRERARALNEIAWNFFYDRAYGKALGAVTALRSRYFSKLFTPETAVLEMLIYRELCQYKQLKTLAAQFDQTFAPILKGITSRQALNTIPPLEQLILQEGVMQKRARIVQDLREERAHLGKSWSDRDLRSWVAAQSVKHEQLIVAEIHRMLKGRLDPAANRVLEYNDEVRFLKYEAALSELQIKESQSTNYSPPEKDRVKTDTLFWPVNEESWMDELQDYEILVTSACRSESAK